MGQSLGIAVERRLARKAIPQYDPNREVYSVVEEAQVI